MNGSDFTCIEGIDNYTTIFGETALPQWEAFITLTTLVAIILFTIIGNILVILSVFTYKPLRIVPNFFIVSLAVADLTVAILVLPLNVILTVRGKWVFGIHVCKMWLTSDVLCCTASILNLCAIALDRFWAITDPINYAQKRTLNRVLFMIAGVWVSSLVISCPPLIGWNDWPSPDEFLQEQVCKLSSRQGYVIYSAAGSFYIPLVIMAVVYAQIFVATRRRLRERAQASRINAISKNQTYTKKERGDRDSVSSETNHNDHNEVNSKVKETKKLSKKKSKEFTNLDEQTQSKPILGSEESVTDIGEKSSQSQKNETNSSNKKLSVNIATFHKLTSKSSALSKVVVVDPPKKAVVYQFIEEKQRISLSKERRAARTLGIIMGVFVVCWLPFFLMYVFVPFCERCCPSFKLINFITWLGYTNSVLNPIIYTIFNMDFRRAFRKLLGLQSH